MGWGLLHQPLNCPADLPTGQSNGDNSSNEVVSFQVILVCFEITHTHTHHITLSASEETELQGAPPQVEAPTPTLVSYSCVQLSTGVDAKVQLFQPGPQERAVTHHQWQQGGSRLLSVLYGGISWLPKQAASSTHVGPVPLYFPNYLHLSIHRAVTLQQRFPLLWSSLTEPCVAKFP